VKSGDEGDEVKGRGWSRCTVRGWNEKSGFRIDRRGGQSAKCETRDVSRVKILHYLHLSFGIRFHFGSSLFSVRCRNKYC